MKKQNTIIVIACLFIAHALSVHSCSPNSTRYCDNSEFIAYVDWDDEDVKQEWEMFEGSIALTQVGLFWKELSKSSDHQIKSTQGGSLTYEIMTLRRAWHLPYYSDAGAYDDEEDGNVNDER